MPRARTIRTKVSAYHVSTRANNKEWFYLPPRECWEIFVRYLRISAARYGTEIHTFVLMSNHFHLILSTPRANIDDFMRYFLSTATLAIQRKTGRINHVLGARYKPTVLESASDLAYVYKYVIRNPVRAGICRNVQDYPYSSFNTEGLPLVEGFSNYWRFIPKEPAERLIWLNRPTAKEIEALVGRALRRSRFGFTKDSNFQKPLRTLRSEYGIESGQ